jgi:hypothetical protein
MGVMTPTSFPGDRRHDTLSGVTSRGTDRRTLRVDEDLWTRFGDAVRALGTDRSTWLRDAIRWAVRDPNAAAPGRPEPDANAD